MENIALENTPLKIVKNFRNFEYLKNIKKSHQAVENSLFSFKVIDLHTNKATISSVSQPKFLSSMLRCTSKD